MSAGTSHRQDIEVAARRLELEFGDAGATIAIVTGSGLGALAHIGEERAAVGFADLPGLGAGSVAGHAGKIALLECDAGVNRVNVLCLQGRRHIYEGIEPELAGYTMRLIARLGVRIVFLTNAAGGLVRRLYPGDLMLLTDHVNLMFHNPLAGAHQPADGPRFPDMSAPYDLELNASLKSAALAEGIELKDGTYLALSGPTYETRAEVRAWQRLGADAVGMSTAPEVLVANQAGMRVAAISLITNSHVHPAAPPTHEEVLEMGRRAGDKLKRLFKSLIGGLGNLPGGAGSA